LNAEVTFCWLLDNDWRIVSVRSPNQTADHSGGSLTVDGSSGSTWS
jgi:hypothetical protein